LPLLVTFSLSFGRISFYMDRYLIIIAPVLTILTVSGLLGLSLRPLRWALVLVFVAATGWGLLNVYFDRSNFAKTDWRALAHTLEAQAQAGTAVITCTDGYRLAYEYYNSHHLITPEDVFDINQLSTVTASPNHQTAWIVVTHPLPSVHTLANIEPPILDKTLLSPAAATWEKHNFEGNVTVAGISAYRYNLAGSAALPEVVAWYCQQSVGVRGRRPQ
jgi:hypothetical protein